MNKINKSKKINNLIKNKQTKRRKNNKIKKFRCVIITAK